MTLLGTLNGPPYGYCSCGWPLFPDHTCSNGECPDGWASNDDDEGESFTDDTCDDWAFVREAI